LKFVQSYVESWVKTTETKEERQIEAEPPKYTLEILRPGLPFEESPIQ
jgi:hypothetical protein